MKSHAKIEKIHQLVLLSIPAVLLALLLLFSISPTGTRLFGSPAGTAHWTAF